MSDTLGSERLLAIVRTQNEISTTALDLSQVMEVGVERARELTGAAGAVIELADGDEMVYAAVSGAAHPHLGLRLRAATSLSGRCVELAEILSCDDSATDPRVDADACAQVGASSLLCVPLTHDGRPVGVLKVYAPRPRAFGDDDAEVLRLLSGMVAAHMAHSEAYARSQQESRTDALTSLANRRAFDERLRAELARARRHGGTLAVLMLDLDGFKAVNDAFGHDAGDGLLRAVATRLRDVRGEDSCFRLGGDEFALVLVAAERRDAEVVAERLCRAIASDPAYRGVGVSCGLAALRRGDTYETLMARADASMYAVKRASRQESARDDERSGSAAPPALGPAAA